VQEIHLVLVHGLCMALDDVLLGPRSKAV
jgi:hypothetical protein